jgi:hypothetical protein
MQGTVILVVSDVFFLVSVLVSRPILVVPMEWRPSININVSNARPRQHTLDVQPRLGLSRLRLIMTSLDWKNHECHFRRRPHGKTRVGYIVLVRGRGIFFTNVTAP